MLGLEAMIVPTDDPDLPPLRALLRKKIARNPGVVVGDLVRYRFVEREEEDGPAAVIEAVEPRLNLLTRAGYQGRPQPVAANLDFIVIVCSPADPPLKPGLIDRYVAAAFHAGVQPVICLNKRDLDQDNEALDELQPYAHIDIPVVTTQATEGQPHDVAQLFDLLTGKRAVLVGHSGVGKSSIACALIPGLDRNIGEVSDYHGRGRHTTTTATLLPLPDGGELVDTPGIRAFGLFGVEPLALRLLYPEFNALADQCRFRTCTHVHEPACAVRTAVDNGDLDEGRYLRYLDLLDSLEHPGE